METSGFFTSLNEDRKYLAKQFADYFSTFIGNGVFGNPANQLKVYQHDGMNVRINDGCAFLNGYWYRVDNSEEITTVTIPANTTSSTVKVYVKLLLDESSARTISVGVTTDATVTDKSKILAVVSVPPLVTTITNSMIQDTRFDSTKCGVVKGLIDQIDTTDFFNQYTAAFEEEFGELGDVNERLNQLSNEIDDSDRQLLETISSSSTIINEFIPNSSYDVFNGEIITEHMNAYVRTNPIEVKSKYFKVADLCSVHCFDENEKWLRATLPLVQGDNMRVYLGEDVKYIAFTIGKTSVTTGKFLISWTDYVFDFIGTPVDYYYHDGVKDYGAKSIEYTFDYHFWNIPLYGCDHINIYSQNFHYGATISPQEVMYSTPNLSEKIVTVTFPYFTIKTQLEYEVSVGKPFEIYKICLYGTSITNTNNEGKYGDALRYLIPCSSDNFVIRGISGGKYSGNIKNNILSHEDTFDLIILEGCANDWHYGVPLEDMETSIHEIMSHLYNKAKNIVFVTDHTNRSYGNIVGGSQHRINGYTSREYYKKCAEMFASYGVTTIDAGMLSGINEFNDEMFVDQIHHSYKGGYVFAKAIYNELIRLNLISAI